MRVESVLRPVVWEHMGRLEELGLGEREHVSEQRDRFVLHADHPRAETLSKRPKARGFIRADRGGLLFRDASPELRSTIPKDLADRAMDSSKGLEFRWTQLSSSDIGRLFGAVMQLASS